MACLMRDLRSKTVRLHARRIALFLFAAGLSGPLMAQYIGAAPPPPAAPIAGMVETPAATLSRNLRLIAQNPRNFDALVVAGRAALDLGDFQAAVGFFGRAEEVRPADPAPKIGMGAASVRMGDSAAALRFFMQAQQLGASVAAMGADRGLAHDLNGNQATAQADYRAALAGPDRDEARRRLALSLGISGDRTSAFATLQPLLMRRDPAAARVRAFVLALLGDRAGARTAIEAAMPGSAARIDPFFAVLPTLTAEQKAAAVHLGVFPTASEMRLASVTPVRSVPQPTAVAPIIQEKRATTQIRPIGRSSEAKVAVARRIEPSSPTTTGPAVSSSVIATTNTTPSISAPPLSAPPDASQIATPQPSASFSLPASTLASVPASDTAIVPAGDRLSGIDKLLAEVGEMPPPPAPRPKMESSRSASDKSARGKKAAESKKAADAKKVAEAKKLAEAKKERDALGVAGTNWVQLAGGSHADRMRPEYKKLAAKSSTLRKRSGHVTQGKDYYRLLVGPFDSKSAAQTFVNSLAKDGVDGFSWTRTPATIKIERLPPK